MEKIAQLAAKRRNERTYLSDRPCRYGHPPVRYTSSTGCVECAKIASRKHRELSKQKTPASPAPVSSFAAAALGDVISALKAMGITGLYLSPYDDTLSIFTANDSDGTRSTVEALAKAIVKHRSGESYGNGSAA